MYVGRLWRRALSHAPRECRRRCLTGSRERLLRSDDSFVGTTTALVLSAHRSQRMREPTARRLDLAHAAILYTQTMLTVSGSALKPLSNCAPWPVYHRQRGAYWISFFTATRRHRRSLYGLENGRDRKRKESECICVFSIGKHPIKSSQEKLWQAYTDVSPDYGFPKPPSWTTLTEGLFNEHGPEYDRVSNILSLRTAPVHCPGWPLRWPFGQSCLPGWPAAGRRRVGLSLCEK